MGYPRAAAGSSGFELGRGSGLPVAARRVIAIITVVVQFCFGIAVDLAGVVAHLDLRHALDERRDRVDVGVRIAIAFGMRYRQQAVGADEILEIERVGFGLGEALAAPRLDELAQACRLECRQLEVGA